MGVEKGRPVVGRGGQPCLQTTPTQLNEEEMMALHRGRVWETSRVRDGRREGTALSPEHPSAAHRTMLSLCRQTRVSPHVDSSIFSTESCVGGAGEWGSPTPHPHPDYPSSQIPTLFRPFLPPLWLNFCSSE